MTAQTRRLALWSMPAALVALGLAAAFWPRAVAIDMVRAEEAP